jgi:alanine racemase
MSGQANIMAVVKANGYGHGIERIAQCLDGADAFAVASLDEAVELRQVGVTHPIVLLEGVFSAQELVWAVAQRVDVVVHSWEQLRMLETTPLASALGVWIKVDSGMHRLGFNPSDVRAVWQRLTALAWVASPLRLITHFAAADDVTSALNQIQLSRFEAALQSLSECLPVSMANSAAIVNFPEAHGDWVRPGIMLYGVSPCAHLSAQALGLQPVMTLVSRVIAIKTVVAGESVGYSGGWIAQQAARLAVVAVGYGDGYPRHAPSGTLVLVNGQPVPVVGRVSMDMITVDVSALTDVAVNDPVVLWGEGLPVTQLAQQAGTIGYELLCGVTKRVPCVEGRPAPEWFQSPSLT